MWEEYKINWKKVRQECPQAYKVYKEYFKDNKSPSLKKKLEFFEKHWMRIYSYPSSVGEWKPAIVFRKELGAHGWEANGKIFFHKGQISMESAMKCACEIAFYYLEDFINDGTYQIRVDRSEKERKEINDLINRIKNTD